ncbi:ATP-binding protein [Mucilaginibacter auburnensis]|uniref:histidine kinase n=1 Tax=Mucilaginibacter auburnensis TaxID=1457233 RepID=A0A2H9VLT8_9SPHI|nr:ATP-binding protein [Mucilaginibacter auburnensis]PJJ79265.1 PAS domain S-box-containing protein [Mucilaginibacter auburnensis]
MNLRKEESTEAFLSGGGEMGKLIRSLDWSQTALGPIAEWPQSLRTSISLCLSSTFPILIAWGPETIQIYNDSYRPICGAKHPESMGMNFRICWETALSVVGDAFTRGQHGEGTYINDQRMFLDRYGYLEESWMTFSFAPIRDETGNVGGIFHPITETTVKMLSGRRTQTLRDLGAAINKAKTVEDIGRLTEGRYADFNLDLPFLLFYQYNEGKASLISASGLTPGIPIVPTEIIIIADESWPLAGSLASGEMEVITGLAERFGDFSCAPYDIAPHTAVILPLKLSGQEEPYGFMIAGVSACRALDQDYLNFYDQLANTYNTAISNVYAYEQEQKRAEALAAIDRSKTAFFSNVSHEFRTPLTLMLGPLEDMLGRDKLPADLKAPLDATHRNALRLLKLVNNLLDYSRVEAGRAQAAYQPVDLAELTADLASSFRSIIEKAGMELIVHTQPLIQTAYVDKQMWEKIVLNLLSNAFKYTLKGTIGVRLKQQGNAAVLEVQDTGVGIPEKELPYMFERFHRVENTAGRTHEGTGIGLSLVHELVHLHGGEISVASMEGGGSTFTIKIPVGKAHLPQEHVLDSAKETDSTALKGAFIQEAFSLLQEETQATHSESAQATGDISTHQDFSVTKDTRLLVVDDNTDMRAYLNRLLEPYFTVITANNGADALQKIHELKPDLVLSDIMMPVMDGKAMLEILRKAPETMRLPVIFLSARAGEEARIDGLEAGADDYLVKPFSAAELLTKVRAQIKISKTRSHAEQQLRDLLTEAPVAIAIYRTPWHLIEFANKRMLEYWGIDSSASFNRPLLEVVPELKAQGFGDIMDHIYRTGERFVTSEIPVVLTKGGKTATTYIHLTVEALRNEDGQITGMMAVAADVTDQVAARHELEKVTDTLKLSLEAANLGTWRSDWGTDNLIVSDITRKIHGLPLATELSFRETLNVIIPEHRDRFVQAVEQAVFTKGRFSENYQIQPYNGSKRKWLNSTGKVELDANGEVTGVIGTILDITESKEDELRKNDFIGMVSHEMKTPLTSLSGYAQMLARHAGKRSDDFVRDKSEKISNQIKKMTTMINGFLNVSRLESGKIALQKSHFELNELICEIIEETEMTSSTHQMLFTPADPVALNADREKIGTVLSNLLSNAVKYSPKGKEINVRTTAFKGHLAVSIKDEGMGINTDDLEKLFDRYYRVENQDTQHIAGFGIGLYLCAEIIERHGGRLWAESEIGTGSIFHFSLPLDLGN